MTQENQSCKSYRLDINKNGFISREDYKIMSKRLTKYSNVTEEQAKKNPCMILF